MKTISLNGTWQLSYGPQEGRWPQRPADPLPAAWRTVPATVPGNVELDLMRSGRLKEPSVGAGIHQLRELETYAWCYLREFDTPTLAPGQRVQLVFEGLDCLATVWVNGEQVGAADNMLVAHAFDITNQLRQGRRNELFVCIESPILAARRRVIDPGDMAFTANWEGLGVRKAPHMYGWDILPRAVSAGLWREVRLDILPATHWRSVYFATVGAWPERRAARALLDWDFVTDRSCVDGMKVRVTLSDSVDSADSAGAAFRQEYPIMGTHERIFLDLQNIRLWWPRGSGEANLYELRLDLLDAAGATVAEHRSTVGLRTAALVRTDLTTPAGAGEFVFKVNGEKIFVKGTNWVPLDAMHSRDGQHLKTTVDMVLDLNCNMVRCWGGNVYEDHAFFDLCDRNGVMVWQDFALACAIYPQDDDFARRIDAEASAVVAKLRNHPSLMLWAGNNEIDEAYQWAATKIEPTTDRLSRQVLPAVVRRLDPLRSYLPSSPYRAPAFFAQDYPALTVLPEQHLWGPRDDFKGNFYTQTSAHFASEIGFHGCPSRKSLEQMMDADHLWPWQGNQQWVIHATQPHPVMHNYDRRIALMAKQIGVFFDRVPDGLDDFILASQISQAEALKFFIEFFRRAKWRRTGILWWNVRDGWPIISDAIVDYYNRKKLAYTYVKRVQSDVCAMIGEPQGGAHEVVAVNDAPARASGRATVKDIDTGQVLFDGAFETAANGPAVVFGKVPAAKAPAVWDIAWTLDGGAPGRNHYLAGPRPFVLSDYRRWLAKLGPILE